MDITNIPIREGGHPNREAGMCAMELVAYFAGEPHTDSPQCTCPVIAAVVRRLNDRLPNDELRNELLRPLVPLLIGTRSTREVEVKRGFIAADFAVREAAPIALDAVGQKGWAEILRNLAPIVDEATAIAAWKTVPSAATAAADAADAAYYSANAAANAANAAVNAGYAVYAAGYAAVNAGYAVYAAGYAAYDGKQAFIACTDMIRRMIEVKG